MAAGFHHAAELFGNEEFRNAAAQQLVVGDEVRDPVNRLDPAFHLGQLRRRQIVGDDGEMAHGHAEFVLQTVVRNDGGQVLGQGFIQLVIDRRVVLRIDRRNEQDGRDQHEDPSAAYRPLV